MRRLLLLLVLASCSQSAEVGKSSDASSACGAPFMACGEDCVDLLNDSSHCGACFQACGQGQTCHFGRCLSASAEDGGATAAADAGGAGCDGGEADGGTAGPDGGTASDAAAALDAGHPFDASVPPMCGSSGSPCARDSDCCPGYDCDTYYGTCEGSGCRAGFEDCSQRACCPGLSCQYDFNAGGSYCQTATHCEPDGQACTSQSDCCLGTACFWSAAKTQYQCTTGESCAGWHQSCQSDTDCCPNDEYQCRNYRYEGVVCISRLECGVIASPCGADGVTCCSGYTCKPDDTGQMSCSN